MQADSPGINAGRGLKLHDVAFLVAPIDDSPGINAGRGLKPLKINGEDRVLMIRPALMPGVD